MLRVICSHFSIFCLLFFAFFTAQSIQAAEIPILVSPADNSNEDKTPKLVWEYKGECVPDGSCFRIEIDDSADFSSVYKSTYTNSFSYSPQGLPLNLWYWRVKARDKSDKWSDWSQVYKFTMGNKISPSPENAQISPSPQANSPSQKIESNFSVKDAPPEVNSDQEFEVNISLVLPQNPNQKFYIKGAFKKSDSSNYFGQTFAENAWVKNGVSYSKQLKIETTGEGKWEGKIKVKVDPEDSGFDGSSDYIFKVARYSESGSGPAWSNELSLKINEVNIPEPSILEEFEEIDESTDEAGMDINHDLEFAMPSREYEVKIASVAGEATMSNNITLEEQTRVLEERKVNWLLIFLGIGIFAGGGIYTFLKIRKKI